MDTDIIAKFYGWPAEELPQERFQFHSHPKMGASHPDWRRKKALLEGGSSQPLHTVHTARLTPDSREEPANRGWKAVQLNHQNHTLFPKHNLDYAPGLNVQAAAGGPPGMCRL